MVMQMNANQLTKIPVEKLSDTLQFLIVENEIPLSDALKQVIDDVDAVCKKLLRDESAPAQPVIPEQQQPIAYIFKHPAGRLFWSLTDESNKRQADVIPVYAEPHELKIPPAIEPDYEVIKGILPTANPDEYACCVAADMWNACRAEMLKAQPVSEPYKLPDERAKYRVIIEGFSNSRTVDFEACSQEEAEEIGRDIFHEECNYGVERLESIPAQESE